MPKKKVAKVKKAKAGKGKKEGKHESKGEKESDIERAKANAALWELRLQVTEQALAQCREACHRLARANEELTGQLRRAETDTVDITGFLKTQEAAKEHTISLLQGTLQSREALAREQRDKLVERYTLEISEMKELFRKKSSDFNMIEDGMKKMKDFQRRKAQMEQDLSDIRESMNVAEKEHRENLNKVEYKFFKEKARLEREAEQTIALVVERAHSEAIVQLDDALRAVFKENVRLNETLKYHMKKEEDLKKMTDSLAKEKASLALDKNTLEIMAKKNAAQMEVQKEELVKLKAKVASLEQALELKAKSLCGEEKSLASNQANHVELEKLQRELAMREKELGHIKQLASTIVEQRTELEQFFHGALAQVRQEILASRLQYKKEALQAYRWTMREATAGKLKFPPIRTFHKSPHSTNSVYSDMEAAARWTHQPGSKVEISDLTWEQKEQVLRLLFGKMNGQRLRKASQNVVVSSPSEKKHLIDSHAAGIREELPAATFMTQAPESVLRLDPNSPTDMHST